MRPCMVYVVACTSACFRGVDVTPDVGDDNVTFEKLETGSSSCAHVTHFVLSTELGRARRSVASACRNALTSAVQRCGSVGGTVLTDDGRGSRLRRLDDRLHHGLRA